MSEAAENAGNTLEDDGDVLIDPHVESKRKLSAISDGPP